ncbi:MAG: replicative DNA helicase [Sphingomonadales bacterium]
MDSSPTDEPHLTPDASSDAATAYRTLPHNIEAEQALLGAILVNNAAAEHVPFLEPRHFFEPLHGRIFEACVKLMERGQIATPVTLKPFFEADEAMRDMGGSQYLAKLAGSVITVFNTETYGRAIHAHSIRRDLIAIGDEMSHDAYEVTLDESVEDQLEKAEQKLFDLAENGQPDMGFKPFNRVTRSAVDMIQAACQSDGHLSGKTTGLKALDEMIGGLHASDLIILAGRPSMGKTALATNIAFNAAKAHVAALATGDPNTPNIGAMVGFFSLEMSAEQLATRMLAEAASISSEKLRRGKLTKDEFHRLVRASQEIEELPFFIDDTPALTISALRSRARRLKRQHGLSFIVVDYLQLLRPPTGSNSDGRVQEITQISQGLKALAKELDLPVLALSQLSRAVEQREDKRPLLSDLRESGSIEQDADIVMFVYREEYYLERKQPPEGTEAHQKWQEDAEKVYGQAEVIIGKQRHGPTGTVRLHFNKDTTKFGDLTDSDHLPYESR